MPKHPKNFLPKFDPNRKDFSEDHIKKLMLVVRLMNVQYVDVVCRFSPYTFENRAYTWYFFLDQASITIWNTFKTNFIENFGKDKTPATLVLDISRIKMDVEEKIKDFNQRFLTLMNKISQASKPTKNVSI
jgi:hypothetical protein